MATSPSAAVPVRPKRKPKPLAKYELEYPAITKRPRASASVPACEKQKTNTKAAPPKRRRKKEAKRNAEEDEPDEEGLEFVAAEAITGDDARSKWPERYQRPAKPEARCHYGSAKVHGEVYALGDDIYVRAGENEPDFIGRITEFFEGTDERKYFACRWFFRAEDTVMLGAAKFVDDHEHDPKRVFLSEHKNDNRLGCIVSKVKIIYVHPNMDPEAKALLVADADLYYDMTYDIPYSTFATIPSADINEKSGISSDVESGTDTPSTRSRTAALLDLYAGCGGMSTGVCLGAALAGLRLETKWAVDKDKFACKSLKYNHPRTEVRNEKAKKFLALLKEWAVLCDTYVHNNDSVVASPVEDKGDDGKPLGKNGLVVEKILDICYGGKGRKDCIYFKVHWKGYGPKKVSWEPIEKLSGCQLKVKEFVKDGHKRNILPVPCDVDVICGGPPCQGISGFNRYGLSSLVALNYQARLGMMAAGCYGLPQFRMRVFLWGALPSMVLPKYPLPTHDVASVRVGAPKHFRQNIVGYDETNKQALKEALKLGDAISDLPKVENGQLDELTEYGPPPETDFQCYIRQSRKDMLDNSLDGNNSSHEEGKLLDHQPLPLNQDDYERVLQIPLKKGANFRDLAGVMLGANNVVEFDPNVKRVYLESRNPLVPDYAMTSEDGKSIKPFGRLSLDETVGTVVTRAEPHNQIILHPEQHRVLTIRGNARLQGFPDYYKMRGPIKEKYKQVGNAVAVPVARALGYSLGQAYLQGGSEGSDPLFVLPESFNNVRPSEVAAER